jgi:hypothetical protein
MTKGKYTAAQIAWLEMTALKVGNKVKVARKAKDHEFGWDNSWEPDMSRTIGKELTIVRDAGEFGIKLKTGGCEYAFPFFVLEPIQEEPSLSGSVVEVKVNGKTYKATIQ